MKFDEVELHLSGASRFIDDMPEPAMLLHGAVCCANVPHAKIVSLDSARARAMAGVCGVFTAKDIPGQNQLGRIIKDEPLLADGEVHFVGQPIAFVIATSPQLARRAAASIEVAYELRPACFDPVAAHANGDLIAPSRTVAMGDTLGAFASCAHVIEGSCDSGGQEHLYMETQGAIAYPLEGDRIKIFAGTQSPTGVQQVTSWVLGVPMHKIEVEVVRLGGGFGGKEDQATPWAVLCALGARFAKRPVKFVLSREEDMRCTGKRHPYHSRYKIGLDAGGKVLAYEATFFQNAGAAADLSTSILERSLFHATGPYFIPNVKVTGHSCRTNLPPFTAFRGFGAPQAVFVIECAMTHAAAVLGMPPENLRETNVIGHGEQFYFGMKAQSPLAGLAITHLKESSKFGAMRREAAIFNATNSRVKKGLALIPIGFGISFTSKFLNQAGALVHIYLDGSVHVSSGAVEMGQGVSRKICVIAARVLGISAEDITIAATDTTRVPNSSPTAASSGADLNGGAVKLACQMLRERLLAFAATHLNLPVSELSIHNGQFVDGKGSAHMSWAALVEAAYMNRINLSAQALYTPPGLDYDKSLEQGSPFAYHVFGACITEVAVDLLRGTFSLSKIHILHDAGQSLVREVDIGQVEGALMQGIGWATMEHLVYGDDGRLKSNALASYKVPDLHFIPEELNVSFIEESLNPAAVYSSKGIGEPPLLYGLATYFAIWDALASTRSPSKVFDFALPFTNERILTQIMTAKTT